MLSTFQCENNLFTSSLPVLINAPRLRFLDLSGNKLTGSIPEGFLPTTAHLSMEYMHLFSNHLSGSLSENVGNYVELRDLLLHENQFTGSIPKNLSNCRHLASLLLQKNSFTGLPDLPFQYHTDSMYQLQTVDISSNAFSGTIPSAFFAMPSIVYFASSQNCFHGELPESVCDSSTLEQLYLEGLRSGQECKTRIFGSFSDVYLSEALAGTIPHCIWAMTSLRFLFLSGNLLGGTLPAETQRNYSSLQYIGKCNCNVFEFMQYSDALFWKIATFNLP